MTERERDRFALIEQLTGKCSIQQIRDRIRAEGLLDFDAEQAELDHVRKLIGRQRKHAIRAGDLGATLANLFEFDDEGNRVPYYKPTRELSLDESVQFIAGLDGKVAETTKKRDRFESYLLKRHGRKLQKRLRQERLAFMNDREAAAV